MNWLHTISANKKLIIVVFIIVLLAIFFETSQQLYYIYKFFPDQNPTFLALFRDQTYRWLVWIVFSSVLIVYIRNRRSEEVSLGHFYNYLFLILGLVAIDIIIISYIQLFLSDIPNTLYNLMQDFLPFFAFQKGPIYTLGYISVALILHYYYAHQHLQIEVLQLEQLKKINADLYDKLSQTFSNKSSFLNIKVGNREKIIPIDDILWVEADDYCSRIHTVNNSAYVMRISLKELEQKLSNNFLRVHRGAIVNMEMVQELQNNGTSQLLLKNETHVSIAKSKLRLVRSFISNEHLSGSLMA